MSRIKGKNTSPEIVVRRIVRSLGYGYRLHVKDLPGTPDLVFKGRKKVIFVHGCFWHMHNNCNISHIPKTRSDYWITKFKRNVERDKINLQALKDMGWSVLVVWECETQDEASLSKTINTFLSK